MALWLNTINALPALDMATARETPAPPNFSQTVTGRNEFPLDDYPGGGQLGPDDRADRDNQVLHSVNFSPLTRNHSPVAELWLTRTGIVRAYSS